MNIPNDTGHPWRLNKFVEYQHKARSVAPPVLHEYALRNNLSDDEKIMLCWFHSLAYSEITAILMLKLLPYKYIKQKDIEEFWFTHKPDLLFGSARKYAKNMDWFLPLMEQLIEKTERKPYEWIVKVAGKGTPENKYDNIYKYLSKWKFMGRFSIERFLEILVFFGEQNFIDLQVRGYEVDWSHGSNLTAGILNIYYKDEAADEFDKTGRITPEDRQFVSEKSKEIFETVLKTYPNQPTKDFIVIISKICSFRNLFKGARYGGFHHDRELEQIISYEKAYPEFKGLWEEIYDVRKTVFYPEVLGEIGGWTGIRKERKKLFLQKGLTGVEGDQIREEDEKLNIDTLKMFANGLAAQAETLANMTKVLVQQIEDYDAERNPGFKETLNPAPQPEKKKLEEKPEEPKKPQEEPEKQPEPKPRPDQEFLDDQKEREESKSIASLVAAQLAREAENDDEDADDCEKASNLEDFIKNSLGNLTDEDEEDEETEEEDESESPEATVKPSTRKKSFAEMMSGEDAEETQEEEEDVRKPIKAENKERVFIAAPYGGNRVDKTLGDKIKDQASEIDSVYFPLEPFHYRESKRHGTQFAVEGCVESGIPFSMETRKIVPEWAIEALAQDSHNSIRIHLNTLDKKKWKSLYPGKKSADPEELIQSFSDCYNNGVFTILKVSPIVPGVITRKDVFELVDRLKNWTPIVEVCFASFTDEEFLELEKLVPKNFDEIKSYYVKQEDRWYVNDEYRESFLKLLHTFVVGSKIDLKILNEAKFDGEEVSVINFKE